MGQVPIPYGYIRINQMGYADDNFNLESPKSRIGYTGDSVNYGVGAGYPYRVSDYLELQFPKFEHWNLSRRVGEAVFIEKLEELKRLKVEKAIYLVNLNDIMPVYQYKQGLVPDHSAFLSRTRLALRYNLDWLRNRSYLYNYLRTSIKTLLTRLDYDTSGFRSIELYPKRNEAVIKSFADSLSEMANSFQHAGISLCFVLLPYEMQISSHAVTVYSGMGYNWDKEFENGLTQKIIADALPPDVLLSNPLSAFEQKSVGHYFVYNLGDKVDWNHLNREGHKIIAQHLAETDDCQFFSHLHFWRELALLITQQNLRSESQ